MSQIGAVGMRRSARSVQRFVPLLYLLATVSFPGQAQIAPDGQEPDTSARSQGAVTAQSDGEDGASTEIRAPMLAPEEAGAGELEIIEPQAAGRRWARPPGPVATSELAGVEAQNEQALSVHSVAALSAVPRVEAPLEAPPTPPRSTDLTEDWPKYGLILSLILAAIFMFWRLGERGRVSDYELIGYTAASSDDQGVIAAEAGPVWPTADDQVGPSSYESLQEAVRAMKAARSDRV